MGSLTLIETGRKYSQVEAMSGPATSPIEVAYFVELIGQIAEPYPKSDIKGPRYINEPGRKVYRGGTTG